MFIKINKNYIFLFLLLINTTIYSQVDSLSKLVLKDNFLTKKLSFNTSFDNFGAVIVDNEMYYASNKKVRHAVQFISKKSKKYFYNIYKVDYDIVSEKLSGTPLLIKGKINTKFNQSSPFVTEDRKKMYYTSNVIKGGNSNSRIFKSEKIDSKWSKIKDLSINSNLYSNAHQVLNKEENTMYFVSDRENGFGKSDIYSVEIMKDGSFGTVHNLGSKINSNENEVHPYITENNELYFSSDRDSSYGGLDVFYVDLNDKEKSIYNLGSAVNSTSDDFSFSINNETNTGFVSSNKDGNLNIYGVRQLKSIREILKKDQIKKDSLIPNFLDSKQQVSFLKNTAVLDTKGKTFLDSIINHLRLNPTEVLDVNSIVKRNDIDLKLYNNRVKSVVDYIESSIKYSYTYVTEEGGSKTYISEVVNNDIAEVGFQFPEIYFDYNSSYLSKKDEKELTGLVKKLLENPLLKVEIKTKTDSRGSNKYNLFLSDKRLNRIKEYLILNGISSNRIVGFSLGESQILNKCIDQSECTDLEHRINRGVNFKFSLQE